MKEATFVFPAYIIQMLCHKKIYSFTLESLQELVFSH